VTRGTAAESNLIALADFITRRLDEFKDNLRKWKDWDKITVIQNHQQIKDYLRGLFQALHVSSAAYFLPFRL
jgi:hypothetical protein